MLLTPATALAESFAECRVRLQASAISAGIPATIAERVLTNATQLERVIQSDRSQPEFVTTFTDYFGTRVNDQRVQQGRKLLKSHRKLLDKVAQDSGVAPHYLIALWGLETNFGSYFGSLSIPSALTTLACDSRRAEFFAAELNATLRIIADGDMTEAELIGSWAGAIGHMQFMPTTFLGYAKDGNGDGKRNLMDKADALTSGGHYLRSIGWQSDYRWGREVLLPKGFDYSTSGADQWRPLEQWAKSGITNAFGKPLAVAPIDAALLLPAGHTGPAFLVYPNYKVIMEWNRSHFYALSVGRLADRIAGAAPVQRSLPPSARIKLKSEQIFALQQRLNELGFPAGEPDGVMGSGTSKAVRLAQQKFGLRADGYPNAALFAAVLKTGQ